MYEIKNEKRINKIFSKYFEGSCLYTQIIKKALSDAYEKGANDAKQSRDHDVNCDVLKVIDRLDSHSIKVVNELFYCGANGDKRLRYSYILRNFTVHEINIILDNYDQKIDDEKAERVANDIDKYIRSNYSYYGYNNMKDIIHKLAEKYDNKED